ncbi:MAG: alpha/beta fold hydrolase [Alphaproteobacteria bacterium]
MHNVPPLPELCFAEIPATSRHRYVGDRLSYMEAGRSDADPVLLLHGIGANSLYWRFQFAGLADRFRLIAWNAPGYFLTDNLRAETPSARDYADALCDFAAALAVERFAVIANSFGTRVAQCVAHYHPGRISCAVFTGTSLPGEPPDERARGLAARAKMIERGGYAFGERAGALVGASTSAGTFALVQQVVRATNPSGFMRAARFVNGDDMPPPGSGLTMPLLMIQGDQDRITPAEANAVRLAAAVPGARIVTLPGIGHLPELEAPQVVNELAAQHFGSGKPA